MMTVMVLFSEFNVQLEFLHSYTKTGVLDLKSWSSLIPAAVIPMMVHTMSRTIIPQIQWPHLLMLLFLVKDGGHSIVRMVMVILYGGILERCQFGTLNSVEITQIQCQQKVVVC